mmetsp:Transcript_4752/g.12196  ORF Transcript_4752/g.12196 Transcript_4752/m.12196 type:complete len:275 (+) Transcript_4752:355-1179(+)
MRDDEESATLAAALADSCSRLGERRARTAGTICRRAVAADDFDGSVAECECITPRGLGFGGGAPAAETDDRAVLARALPRVPPTDVSGRPGRCERGDTSDLSACRCSRPEREDDGCSVLAGWPMGGEVERPGDAIVRNVLILLCKPAERALMRFVMLLRPLVLRELSRGSADTLLGPLLRRPTRPLAEPTRGEGCSVATMARSGDGDRRLPMDEFDCTEEDRRTPEGIRHGMARPHVAPPVPPSKSLLVSSSKRSCCCSCWLVASIWVLICENW